jgi:hypothetical protein
VTRFTASAVDQEAGFRGSLGETAKQRTERLVLRKYHMQPIATAARLRLRDVPEFSSLRMPDDSLTGARLVAASAAMLEAAQKYQAVLVDSGVPEEAITGMAAAAAAVTQSIDTRAGHRKRRSGGTSGLTGQERRANAMIAIADAAVTQIIGGDDALLGQWKTAKRVVRKLGPVSGGVPSESMPSAPSAPPATPAPKAA